MSANQCCSCNECCTTVFPSTHPCSDSLGFYAIGEYLYFQPSTSPIILSGKVSGVDLTNFIIDQTTIKTLKYSWNSGFRVGVGYISTGNGWDINLSWMRLNTNSTTTVKSVENEFLFLPSGSVVPNASSAQFADQVIGKANLKFDTIDFDIGREYFLNRCFFLRPHFGLKGAYFQQTLEAKALNVFAVLALSPDPILLAPFLQLETGGKFQGIGPKIGLSGKWIWFCDFGLFGKVSGAMLWGTYKNVQGTTSGEIEISQIPIEFSFSGTLTNPDNQRVRPMVESQLGIDWKKYYCCDRFFFRVAVSYEVQHYWDLSETVASSYLNIKGLTILASIGF